MEHTEKEYIDDLNYEETRGRVLDEFIALEMNVDEIIIQYLEVSKEKERFARNVLLNSSITSFGTKMKLLKNIAINEKIELEGKFWHKLHSINNLRNAFAHCDGQYHMIVTVYKAGEMPENPKETIIERKFQTMSSDGKIQFEEVRTALYRFNKLKIEIKNKIKKFLKKEDPT